MEDAKAELLAFADKSVLNSTSLDSSLVFGPVKLKEHCTSNFFSALTGYCLNVQLYTGISTMAQASCLQSSKFHA